VAAMQSCSTSLWSTSNTLLESVLWKLLDWSWRSTCLATPFTRNCRHKMYSYGTWTV
jgi:hypothetical protein